jgi:DNA-binding transcriptional LysR family regulator
MDRLMGMRVFLAVADAASFSAAGRTLSVSKAMVSKHVRQLEDGLGVRLLQRSTRWVRLTEAGSVYQARCRQILADIDEAERAVLALHAEPRGLIRVVAPTSLGTFHLAPVVSDYTASYPEVQVRLSLNDRAEDPIRERSDVVIRIGRLPSSNLIARRIGEARLVTCAAPAYLQRFGVPAVPGDLLDHNCFVYSGGSARGWWFGGPEGDYALAVGGDFEASGAEAVRMAALRGQGLVQLASYMVQRDLEAGRLLRVLVAHEAEPLPIYAVYAGRCQPASVRTFIEFLEARFLGCGAEPGASRAARDQSARAGVMRSGEAAPPACLQAVG